MSETTKPRIAVIGSDMVDLVTYVKRTPVKGETVEAPSFAMGHGGKGANQAVATAKLGASVVMVTAVGDDMFADNTIKNLAELGIDTTYVRRVAGKSSGVAPIMVEPSGEPGTTIRRLRSSSLINWRQTFTALRISANSVARAINSPSCSSFAPTAENSLTAT
jgi:ribokinase